MIHALLNIHPSPHVWRSGMGDSGWIDARLCPTIFTSSSACALYYYTGLQGQRGGWTDIQTSGGTCRNIYIFIHTDGHRRGHRIYGYNTGIQTDVAFVQYRQYRLCRFGWGGSAVAGGRRAGCGGCEAMFLCHGAGREGDPRTVHGPEPGLISASW